MIDPNDGSKKEQPDGSAAKFKPPPMLRSHSEKLLVLKDIFGFKGFGDKYRRASDADLKSQLDGKDTKSQSKKEKDKKERISTDTSRLTDVELHVALSSSEAALICSSSRSSCQALSSDASLDSLDAPDTPASKGMYRSLSNRFVLLI
jgi:hypothetical protein